VGEGDRDRGVAAINDARAVPYLVHIMGASPICSRCASRRSPNGPTPRRPGRSPLPLRHADVRYTGVKFLQKARLHDHAAAVAKLHEDPNSRSGPSRARPSPNGASRQGSSAPVPLLDRLLVQLAQQEGDDLIIASGSRVHEEGGTVTRSPPQARRGRDQGADPAAPLHRTGDGGCRRSRTSTTRTK